MDKKELVLEIEELEERIALDCIEGNGILNSNGSDGTCDDASVNAGASVLSV
jgi:hypothetical protein